MSESDVPVRRSVASLLLAPWQREEIRYLVVGGFNTVVGLGLYAGFHALLSDQIGYLLTLVPAYAVGIVISFFTQRYLVFGAHGQMLKDFLRFTSVQLSGLGLNAIVLALVHGTTSIPAVPSQAISLFIVAIATYFSHKFFSFRRVDPGESADGDAEGEPAVPLSLGARVRAALGMLWARSRPWHPILIGVIVASVASLSFLQWSRPYIQHDDWDMLLPNGPPFVENHTLRLLHEGRWLNFWWWQLGSQHLSAQAAVLLFAAGWLVTVALFVRALTIGWWSVLAVVALYGAPMMSDLSYWPATLAAPIWAVALTLALAWFTRDRWIPHLVLTGLGTILIVPGYPPLALIVLPFLVAIHYRSSWWRLLAVAATFAGSYVAGILVVFALNDIKFGVFGIKIQPWRDPTSLNSMSALGNHLSTAGNDYVRVMQTAGLPLIAALLAIVVALLEPALRRPLAVFTLALLGAMALNSASTISNGVFTPFRAMVWIWAFVVLIAAWALQATRKPERGLAALVLLFIAAWSATYWALAVRSHYDRQDAFNQLQRQIIAQYDAAPQDPVVFAVTPQRFTDSPFARQIMWVVGSSVAKNGGVMHADRCVDCMPIMDYIHRYHVELPVFTFDGDTIIQLRPAFMHQVFDARPYPSWLVPFWEPTKADIPPATPADTH